MDYLPPDRRSELSLFLAKIEAIFQANQDAVDWHTQYVKDFKDKNSGKDGVSLDSEQLQVITEISGFRNLLHDFESKMIPARKRISDLKIKYSISELLE